MQWKSAIINAVTVPMDQCEVYCFAKKHSGDSDSQFINCHTVVWLVVLILNYYTTTLKFVTELMLKSTV